VSSLAPKREQMGPSISVFRPDNHRQPRAPERPLRSCPHGMIAGLNGGCSRRDQASQILLALRFYEPSGQAGHKRGRRSAGNAIHIYDACMVHELGSWPRGHSVPVSARTK